MEELELSQVVMVMEDMALVERDLALLVMGQEVLDLVALDQGLLDQVGQEDMELVVKQESLQSLATVHLWVALDLGQVTDLKKKTT